MAAGTEGLANEDSTAKHKARWLEGGLFYLSVAVLSICLVIVLWMTGYFDF
jgi:hypothetical protein